MVQTFNTSPKRERYRVLWDLEKGGIVCIRAQRNNVSFENGLSVGERSGWKLEDRVNRLISENQWYVEGFPSGIEKVIGGMYF